MLVFRKELLSRYGGPVIRKILIQNAFQVSARSPFEIQLMLLQKAQTGSNDLRLVVKPSGGDKTLNHLLKMRSDDFAHVRRISNSLEQLSKVSAGQSSPSYLLHHRKAGDLINPSRSSLRFYANWIELF